MLPRSIGKGSHKWDGVLAIMQDCFCVCAEYEYGRKLVQLESRAEQGSVRVPERARGVATSLSLEKWEQLLLGYPDEGFMLCGIRGVFRIGFQAG